MADRLDVLLGILLDKAAQKDVVSGISAIEKELGKLDDTQLYKLSLELEAVGEATEQLEDNFAQARQEAERLNTASEKLTRVSAGLFIAGSAIIGGIALSAQQYVSFIEEAGIQGDKTADRWTAATKRVQNASLNVGAVAAQTILPIYEKAAELTEKAAKFVNENPDIIRAALNTGVVVATLGAVGLAVSKGIRLYADLKYLAATAEYSIATTRFERSVREYLTGSLISKPGTVAGAATGGAAGKALGTLGAVTLLASSVIIGTEAGVALGNALGKLVYGPDYKKQGLADAALTATRAANLPGLLGAQGLQALGEYNPLLARLGQIVEGNIAKTDNLAQRLLGLDKAAEDAANSTGDLANGVRDFQQEADMAAATQSYIQYRQQEAQAEQQYMAQRAQIVSQGAAQLAQIEANYANQRAQLASQFAQQSSQAVSNFQYQQAQALEQFNRSEAQAQQQNQQQRAQVVEDAREAELQAEQDHQREMQRLEEDSQDRQLDLISQRDALGLVRERRDLARQQRQAEEDFNAERIQRRQETRERLREMQEQFQQERARRREEFEYQQAQALEQFQRQQELAKAQYEERLKQLEEQHRAEVAQAQRKQAEQLRELENQYRQEQITRRNAFYDILRDLNANLLGEQQLRQAYYVRMQADLQRFLSSSTITPGSNLPGYQSGGYTPASGGAIRTHPDEWVANKETTRALESLIGGRLTQKAVQGFAQSGGASTYNLSFPGGLVTVRQLAGLMEENNAKMLRDLTRGLK